MRATLVVETSAAAILSARVHATLSTAASLALLVELALGADHGGAVAGVSETTARHASANMTSVTLEVRVVVHVKLVEVVRVIRVLQLLGAAYAFVAGSCFLTTHGRPLLVKWISLCNKIV